jgi:hypothetical protein
MLYGLLNADHLTARAYSMIPFMWSAGSIFGAAMGGYLARPALTWPSVFPEGNVFSRFPYLLPNAVAAAYIVFAIALGMAFLKETNTRAHPRLSAQLNISDEQTPLLQPEQQTAPPGAQGQLKPKERRVSLASMPPLTAGSTIDIRRLSVSTTADSVKPAIRAEEHDTAIDDAIDDDEAPPKHEYSRAMILLIVQLFLMSYHQMGFSSLTPVFLLDTPSDNAASESSPDLRGGLGYTIRDVGGFMSVNGFAALFIQGVVFAPFVGKVGVWKSVVWMTALSPLVYVVVPFLTAIPHPQAPIGIYAVLILQNFALIIIYPCLLITLKNATPSLSMLGQVNGLAMAGCSGARTVAPPVAGFVYSKAGSAAAWWSVGVVAILAGVLLCFMKPPPQAPDEEEA